MVNEWLKDMPQQFQNKRNITILLQTIAKQFQEALDMLEQIRTETTLDTASGINLDMLGEHIVGITRADAGVILGYDKDDSAVTDEMYRQVIKFKISMNTMNCTYYDIVDAMSYIFDLSSLKFTERDDYPATIIFDTDLEAVDETSKKTLNILTVKPAGVQVLYNVNFKSECSTVAEEKFTYEVSEIKGFGSKIDDRKYTVLDGTRNLDGTWVLDGGMELPFLEMEIDTGESVIEEYFE